MNPTIRGAFNAAGGFLLRLGYCNVKFASGLMPRKDTRPPLSAVSKKPVVPQSSTKAH